MMLLWIKINQTTLKSGESNRDETEIHQTFSLYTFAH